jgi:ubiquinone biosynthesis protein
MLDAVRELLETMPLVPESYRKYRPLVIDGLLFFLEHLPLERQGAILAEQMELAESATSDDRLVALLRQCPTLHKLGQVVAHDSRLTLELRARLQTLESLPPASGLYDVAATIRNEVGEIAGLEVASESLAEGSVAIVVPFVLNEPGAAAPQRGVFKVLKPLAEERLLAELELWPALGEFLGDRCEHYGLPSVDYRNTLDSVRHLLLNEIRLDLEQKHLAAAAQFYADLPAVHIPRLLPFCTPRVTAMERIDGRKVTDPGVPPEARHRLAETLIEALLAKPFWSSEPIARFHADAHAGNLFLTDDGRLAILDWALVTELTRAQRAAVVQAVLGGLTLDETQTCRSIETLGTVSDGAALRTVVSDAVRQVRKGTFPGFDWLTELLDRLAGSAAVHFPEELTLFRKTLLSLTGVVSDVSGRPSLDRVLTKAGALQFLRELPGRALAPMDSRDFGTHLSDVDLLCTWAALSLLPSRYWIETWRDALQAWAHVPPRQKQLSEVRSPLG